MKRIEPRSGVAFTMCRGTTLTVCDPQGPQVSDLVAYNGDDVREGISNGRTFDCEETIHLNLGNRLWSNRSNPMLTIINNTAQCHDFLLTPCSEQTFRHFYPDKPVHRGCLGNLVKALEPYGIGSDDIPTAFNIFMNVPVDSESGLLAVKPPKPSAGDKIQFCAEMDLIIGLTACSAYDSNGESFKPIDYSVSEVI